MGSDRDELALHLVLAYLYHVETRMFVLEKKSLLSHWSRHFKIATEFDEPQWAVQIKTIQSERCY